MRGPRKPTLAGFGAIRLSKPRAAPKSASPAVMRKPAFEQMLCEAIRAGVTVELRYQKPDEGPDFLFRVFGPVAVYKSEQDKISVSGEELVNPNEPGKKSTPHNFEIGRIVDLRVTANPFQPSAAVDYTQAKYRNGIICRR